MSIWIPATVITFCVWFIGMAVWVTVETIKKNKDVSK